MTTKLSTCMPMTTEFDARAAAEAVGAKLSFTPEVAVVLGSGLGAFADTFSDGVTISYSDIPGFASSTVGGHAGELIAGEIGETKVICLSGRSHIYEGVSSAAITTPIRTLKLLGVKQLLLTNASGSLRPEVGPGSLVLVSDHINFQFGNPLIGPNADEFGPRFVSMRDAYDPGIRAELKAAAKQLGTPLGEGVYIATSGPMFETAAEIRAFKTLGADLVGMSTVAEVITARHCDLKVAALSTVTNLAEGLSDIELSHDQTLSAATSAADKVAALLTHWLQNIGSSDDSK